MKEIYLDNAATSFPKPQCVYDSVINSMINIGANAGRGGYKKSKKASEILNDAREAMAKLVKISNPNKVIFQPSATIATNVILNGIEWENIENVYVTPFEHNAIMRTLEKIHKEKEINIITIPFDNISFELKEIEFKKEIIRNKPDLVIMSHVSNVTGYILPIEQINKIVKEYHAITIVDSSQGLGIVDIDLKNINIDFIIFAGHKGLYAPFGIGGFIYNNEKIRLNTSITGGTGSDSTNLEMPNELPYRYECGSYNIEAISGLLSGINFILEEKVETINKKIKGLTEKLQREIEGNENIEIYVPEDSNKHIGIISLNLDGYKADEIANILDDEFNIAVRAGHHCAPKIGEFLGGQAENGVLRISIGYFNDEKDIEVIIEAIEGIY